jgi:A118 family predicted phage portal protein
MFQRFFAWIKEAWRKMLNRTDIKKISGAEPSLSTEMINALQLWTAMYENKSPWLSADVKSLNLAAAVSAEIARLVTIEMRLEVDGSSRAAFLEEQLSGVMTRIREHVEAGSASGGMMLKPYVDGNTIQIDVIPSGNFYPVRYDSSGRITAVVFADQKVVGEWVYTRIEYHDFGDVYIIRNKAFRSRAKNSLGTEVALSFVEEWAEILPEATLTGVTVPLYGYFRFPAANNIDATSPLGVSCFARAVDQIREADEQWSRFVWEFKSGERALYVDVSAFDRDKDGKPILPSRRLFRTLHGMDTPTVGEEGFFEEWSPTLREESLLNGLDAILKRVEFNCGLAYGTLSDPKSVEKTATEIKTSRQRSYVTVTDTQKALERALRELTAAMDMLATLYKLAPPGTYELTATFDDSVVTDKEAQSAQDRQTVSMGAMPKYQFLMRNYGLSEEAAREWISEVQSETKDQELFGDQGV